MSLDQYDYYLVLDLEATCCDQGTIKRHEMEIIEIGAVMVEAPTLLSVRLICEPSRNFGQVIDRFRNSHKGKNLFVKVIERSNVKGAIAIVIQSDVTECSQQAFRCGAVGSSLGIA